MQGTFGAEQEGSDTAQYEGVTRWHALVRTLEMLEPMDLRFPAQKHAALTRLCVFYGWRYLPCIHIVLLCLRTI